MAAPCGTRARKAVASAALLYSLAVVDNTTLMIAIWCAFQFSLNAIVAPLLGAWGVWVSGAALVAVALVWLIPDRRIEHVLPRD